MKKLLSTSLIIIGVIALAVLICGADADDEDLYGDGYDPDYGA